ncbi:MAG: hypothetical protein AMK69_25570 [Nitrospira bacterium SG8_3]|nr:MAG: hypothetical protein AMK69_25570 [Nitrospira bacterium SG8_3]
MNKKKGVGKQERLYYLDWLRVLAILGVFLFHAVHPFDMFPWEIKNADQSVAVTLFIVFLGPWGMPLFFLLSGVGSQFALRRRTSKQYLIERVNRLLIPFIVGSVLLSPLQLYFQWAHQLQTGVFDGSLLEFFQIRDISIGPRFFGWAGFHLWFLGFLFAYSIIALPIFQWLKQGAGKQFVDWLVRICSKRGGLLLFILPLMVVQFIFRPYFPMEHDWTDFLFSLVFFIVGYILYSDQRFEEPIKRDWKVMLIFGIISTLFFFGAGAADRATEWMETSGTLGYYMLWGMWSINAWCWTLFMLFIGMRYLDFTNKLLQYGQDTIMPFFLFHQPVIIIIAFYVVQWEVGVTLKLITVVLSSFVISFGLVEFVLRRIKPVRKILGMKS